MPLNDRTFIESIETEHSVKAEIHLKRNDPLLNCHCRIIAQEWQGNTDWKVLFDHQMKTDYLTKYVCKGEKMSNPMAKLFNDVVRNSCASDDPKTKIRSLMI